MDKKEQILHDHRIDGLSQREIASRVGVSRQTVKRFIIEYETLAQTDPRRRQSGIWRLSLNAMTSLYVTN
jgi:transposase